MMPFLGTIGRIVGKAAGILFGVGSSTPAAGGGIVDRVAAVADEYKYTDEEKAKDAVAEADSIRHIPIATMPEVSPLVMQSGGLIGLLAFTFLRLINSAVDALNHAIRPGVFVIVLLGIFGVIELPPNTDERLWSLLFWILPFFYGGRMIIKDLPSLISAFRTFQKK